MSSTIVTVHDFCSECDTEISFRVRLVPPQLGCGPIDYVEVEGDFVDRCPNCGVEIPADVFTRMGEKAIEEDREHYRY